MKPTCFPVPSIHDAGSISFNKLQVKTTLLIYSGNRALFYRKDLKVPSIIEGCKSY
jgi:hypothetical protein